MFFPKIHVPDQKIQKKREISRFFPISVGGLIILNWNCPKTSPEPRKTTFRHRKTKKNEKKRKIWPPGGLPRSPSGTPDFCPKNISRTKKFPRTKKISTPTQCPPKNFYPDAMPTKKFLPRRNAHQKISTPTQCPPKKFLPRQNAATKKIKKSTKKQKPRNFFADAKKVRTFVFFVRCSFVTSNDRKVCTLHTLDASSRRRLCPGPYRLLYLRGRNTATPSREWWFVCSPEANT